MYRKFFTDKYIANGYTFDEAISEVDFLFDVLFNYTYKDFMLGKTLNEAQCEKVRKMIEERLQTHKPIQKIAGQAYFLSRKFFVDENTLVPRPETELLVDEALKLCIGQKNVKILDIGTGTGCIPISLVLENGNIIAEAIDISEAALETARRNALYHNVYDKIKFYQSDLLDKAEGKFDIIVSNPPYIPLKDKDELQIEVRDYDPALALFTKDEKGIEFYEKIIRQGKNYLNKNGKILFELGKGQRDEVSKLFESNGFKVIKAIKDYNNIDRVLIAEDI
ncbi:peptide chain release factor N(5)-glutamine methyltransferase [bacterium]|nr:peptide chain release factor N(5)-glutamine methyltransferase [bacterium]